MLNKTSMENIFLLYCKVLSESLTGICYVHMYYCLVFPWNSLDNGMLTVIFFSLRQQASELHRRKAVESSQSATDLKLHLDKYHAQLKDAQNAVANNTSGMHQEVCKYKRVQVNK